MQLHSSPDFHFRCVYLGGTVAPGTGADAVPSRTMEPNSETRGIYLARTMDGELNTGFDAKRVLAQQGGA